MERADPLWNDTIKNNCKLLVRAKKAGKRFWRDILNFLPALWDLIVIVVVGLLCLCMMAIFFIGIPAGIVYEARQSARANEAMKMAESSLRESGYTELKCGCDTRDYVAGETLARKRCDDEFGLGNYSFASTNFGGSVWYKAEKKER